MADNKCPWCHDTGWTGTVDGDGNAYIIACPDGCPAGGPL